ncbi:hypothetical protein SAMN05444416_107101 [Thermoactinomyces sp. DSM 45892]|nr:hypothetical protein SAMN05444416_107101 [Thermoactinomyces sp. DSM 45892]
MDFIHDIYTNLMQQGYKLQEVEGIDIRLYFRLLAHQTKVNKPQQVYIDQIPFL